MSRRLLLLDCDGIVADCLKAMLLDIEYLFGIRATPEQLNQWDVIQSLNLTNQQAELVYRRMHEPGWARRLEVLPGAIEGLAALEKVVDTIIVTAPQNSPTWQFDRNMWFLELFNIHHSRICHWDQKHRIPGDFFADDKPTTVQIWNQHQGHRGKGFVWDLPFTRTILTHLPRVNGWDHLLEIVS